tara:strand:- start:41 stop:562 length:522 start_codon:yes stop_codon:yes gene_type:complete
MFDIGWPTIEYDSVGQGQTKTVTDLLRRVALRAKVKTNTVLYDYHDIVEGDSPESVAFEFYGDPKLSWVVLITNDITDRYHQWPMAYHEFIQHVNDKYSDINATHHYYITQSSGDTDVRINIGADNTDHSGATIVTNLEYEEDLQNQMRRIRILSPTYVNKLINEYKRLINED